MCTNGIVTLPILALHRPFHLVNGVVVDYLHCVLLGVTKMLTEFWFDKAHKGKPYHIGNKVIVNIIPIILLVNPKNHKVNSLNKYLHII